LLFAWLSQRDGALGMPPAQALLDASFPHAMEAHRSTPAGGAAAACADAGGDANLCSTSSADFSKLGKRQRQPTDLEQPLVAIEAAAHCEYGGTENAFNSGRQGMVCGAWGDGYSCLDSQEQQQGQGQRRSKRRSTSILGRPLETVSESGLGTQAAHRGSLGMSMLEEEAPSHSGLAVEQQGQGVNFEAGRALTAPSEKAVGGRRGNRAQQGQQQKEQGPGRRRQQQQQVPSDQLEVAGVLEVGAAISKGAGGSCGRKRGRRADETQGPSLKNQRRKKQ
jgi:hypothetical protein